MQVLTIESAADPEALMSILSTAEHEPSFEPLTSSGEANNLDLISSNISSILENKNKTSNRGRKVLKSTITISS